VSFPEAISTCFRKYAVFRGRASRSEFWWFVLFYYAILFVSALVLAAADPYAFEQSSTDAASTALTSIWFVGFLSLLVPYLAAGVRRLHDTGKSGWWWFVTLIPFVGSIVLIVFLASEGERVWNRYGSPPGVQTAPPGVIPPPPPPPPP
jgi:uncharacterized membrane protein YhaH (DUF805 family)